jgi:hypothetical protein
MSDTKLLSLEVLRFQAETIRNDIDIKVETLGAAGLQIEQYYNELTELGFDLRAIRSGIGNGMSYHQVTASEDSTNLIIVA